jgi:hypothetical protein
MPTIDVNSGFLNKNECKTLITRKLLTKTQISKTINPDKIFYDPIKKFC